MDFFEAVTKRRAMRKFSSEAVPDAVIERALDAALLAPNSSNLQPWEFYWVKSPEKKARLAEACLGQNAAKTAAHLIVAVSRVDTWKRNRRLYLDSLAEEGPLAPIVQKYYQYLVPLNYTQDPFGILGVLKKIFFSVMGLFRPVPRGPYFRSELFETVTKTTALACENLMLALVAQGFDSCPMEGFDQRRVKRLLGLGWHTHVVMVIGIGRGKPETLHNQRIRVPRELVVKEV